MTMGRCDIFIGSIWQDYCALFLVSQFIFCKNFRKISVENKSTLLGVTDADKIESGQYWILEE
jgi:hypothetical protein